MQCDRRTGDGPMLGVVDDALDTAENGGVEEVCGYETKQQCFLHDGSPFLQSESGQNAGQKPGGRLESLAPLTQEREGGPRLGFEVSAEALIRKWQRRDAAGRLNAGAGMLRDTPGNANFAMAETPAVVGNSGQAPDFSLGPLVESDSDWPMLPQ